MHRPDSGDPKQQKYLVNVDDVVAAAEQASAAANAAAGEPINVQERARARGITTGRGEALRMEQVASTAPRRSGHGAGGADWRAEHRLHLEDPHRLAGGSEGRAERHVPNCAL